MNKLKKFICLALVICFMVPAVLLLSACGPTTIEVSTFEELKQALAGNSDIVQLKNDITITEMLPVSRKVTLDLNGKKLENTTDIYNEETYVWSFISVKENGDLTIKGDGKLKTKKDDCYCLDVDGGNLTIEGGEYIGNVSAVYAYVGNVFIKGGKFSIQQLNTNKVEGPRGLTINVYNEHEDNGTAKVEITGGEFDKFDPTDKTDNKHDNLVPQGYKSVLKEGTTDVYVVVKNS